MTALDPVHAQPLLTALQVAHAQTESAEAQVRDAAYWARGAIDKADRMAEGDRKPSLDGILKGTGPFLDTAVAVLAARREHEQQLHALAERMGVIEQAEGV